MIVVGLTGSVGMGKSTTAALFAEEGLMVYDADAEVHRLQAKGGRAIAPIEAAFPGVIKDGAVDRAALGAKVFGDAQALQQLNRIVHPLLGESRTQFFNQAKTDNADIVVLDIPLLFETGGESAVDAVVVVTAPQAVQRQRVLERPGYDEARLAAILARQTPDKDKCARADFIIDTGRGLDFARKQVRELIAVLRQPNGLAKHKAQLEGRRELSQS